MPVPNMPALNMLLFHTKKNELVHNLPKFLKSYRFEIVIEENQLAMPVPNIPALDMLLFHKKKIKFFQCYDLEVMV